MHFRHVILNPEAYFLSNKKSNEPVKSLYAFLWVIHWRLKMEDGTDRAFRNVGISTSDAGESPRRKGTSKIFRTRRKFEIKE
jgi:hypothetical protein